MYPSLVLVQPRKTRPCFTERLLMARKESNQTNKTIGYLQFAIRKKKEKRRNNEVSVRFELG